MSQFSKFASRARGSAPGDAERQGRAAPPAAVPDDLVFVDAGGRVTARLGVVVVGEITINPASGARAEYFWTCYLPMTPQMRPAETLEKAKGALAFNVRDWCAAAGVVTSAAALARLQGKK